MIDGCSAAPGASGSITFPLLAPGLVATGVFGFIQAWNEFTARPRASCRDPRCMTLPVWLRTFQQATGTTDWAAIMAGSTLMAIPVIDLLPDRAGAHDERPRQRGGEGMSGRQHDRSRRAHCCPASPARDAARTGCAARCWRDGLGGRLPVRRRTSSSRAQLRALTDAIRRGATRTPSSRSTRRAATSPGSTTTAGRPTPATPCSAGSTTSTHRAVGAPRRRRSSRAVGVHPQLRAGRRRQLEPATTRSSACAASAPTPRSSPRHVGGLGRAALQAAGVAACAKHFPGPRRHAPRTRTSRSP